MSESNASLDPSTRLKRLRMRSWRRGMKEMDIILGGFVDRHGESFSEKDFDALETIMDRNDQKLFAWISGASTAPNDASEAEKAMIAKIIRAYDNV